MDGYSGGQAGRIYHPAGLSPTIDTSTGGNSMPKIAQSQPFSVRRLTPREVYRVQDVDDSSIDLLLAATDDKGKPALSLTSHYFLAGNSIAVAPLAYIIESLFFAPAPPRQPTIFD